MLKRREPAQPTQERPLLLVRLQQNVRLQQRYLAQLPKWRHPLVGYLVSIPLVACGLLLPYAELMLTGHAYSLGAPLFLGTVIVALFWGSSSAIFALVVGALAAYCFFIPPFNDFTIKSWQDSFSLVPYCFAGFVVALITAQREVARRRALFADLQSQEHAEELEQINQQLEQTNQLKNLFFSRASHELKTPLTTIRGHAQIGLRHLAKVPKGSLEVEAVKKSLEKIDEQTYRLHALVDDLLDISILASGKMNLRLRRCDIGEMCREIVEEQLALSGRKIELTLPPKSLSLRVDSERLGQVVINLVTNAIKYSPPESVVRLCIAQESSDVLLSVHNEGAPIPEDQQQSIFEPFYRASNAHKLTKQGWGLGLAICKDIVERHNGRIWVESTIEAGTTFYVKLPL